MKIIKTFSDTDGNIAKSIEHFFEASLTQSLAVDENTAHFKHKSKVFFKVYIHTLPDANRQLTKESDSTGAVYIFLDKKPLFFNKKNTLVLNRQHSTKQWQQNIQYFVEKIMQQPIDPLLEEFSAFNLCGRSTQFINIIKMIKKLAHCDAPLLIQGETGTGKENTARAVHYLSARRDHAFVPINCGAITENLIESELFGYEQGAYTGAEKSKEGLIDIAHNGTLFLDEVDSLSAKAQTVLLRFLQTGEYRTVGGRKLKKSNVHIITATNAKLENNISQQTFRQDLYYRLNVLTIDLPPLRERPEDIKTIAESLLKKLRVQHNVPNRIMSEGFIDWLQQQRWAGNIRELENTLLREFLLCTSDIIEAPDATTQDSLIEQPSLSFKAAKDAAIARFEIAYIQKVLKLTNGNVSRAAKIAGKERRAFGKLIKKHHIERMHWVANKTHEFF